MRRLVGITVFSFIVILASINCGSRDFVKKPVVISTLFSPNEKTNYKISVYRSLNVYHRDTVASYSLKYNLLIEERIVDVTSRFITIKLSIKDAQGKVEKNGSPYPTDVFNNLIGKAITVKLDLNGNLVEISGTEQIPTLLGTKAEQVSDMEIFGLLYDYFKPTKLKPDQMYKKNTRTGVKVFRYQGINKALPMGAAALFTFRTKYNYQDAGIDGMYKYFRTTKGHGEGQLYHLLKDARVWEANEKFSITDHYHYPSYVELDKTIKVYNEISVEREIYGGE